MSGSSNDKCYGYESCKDFLEEKTKRKFSDCLVLGCTEKAEDGGHVEIWEDGARQEGIFIIPLCKKHNNHNNTERMKLKDKSLENKNSNVVLYSQKIPKEIIDAVQSPFTITEEIFL